MRVSEASRWLAALVAASAAGLSPASAKDVRPPAPAVFDLAYRLCIENEARLDRVLGEPELQNWTKVPFGSLKAEGVKFRRKTIQGETYAAKRSAFLMAGVGDLKTVRGDVPFRTCSVTLEGADEAASIRAVQAWSGGSPQRQGAKTSFRQHVVAGRRVPVANGTVRELASSLTGGPPRVR
jgi:hypothetical protein